MVLQPNPNPAPGTLYERKLAQATSEGLGMNWYKIIIYVQCFLGCLIDLVSGITQILGLQYGDRASLVYSYYSGLKIVDILFGLSSIAIGILMVYVRFGLKKYQAKSVGIYLFLPLVNAIVSILYFVAASLVLHTSLFDADRLSGETIGLIVGSIGLFIVNYIYFGHRRHLFNEA